MGCCSQGIDSRYETTKCPLFTIQSPMVVIPLPLKFADPPTTESMGSVPNSMVEEHNARLRVGHKLMNDLNEAVTKLLEGYKGEARMISEFNRD